MKKTLFLTLLLFAAVSASAQIKRVPLSPLQVLKQSIAHTDITITYSRPAMRDRVIFGDLVPYNERWRTGANRNSKVTFSENVMIGDSLIKAGSYALLTLPSEKEWIIYFYKDVSHWEVPEPWDESLVAAQMSIKPESLPSDVQSMTFSIDEITYESCVISLAWEKTRISIPVEILTEDQMMADIDKALAGPSASDFYLAAVYREGTGEDLGQALEWIDKAMTLRDENKYWDALLKAKILLKMNKVKEAKMVAELGLDLAKSASHQYGMKLMNELLEDIKRAK